MKTKDIIIHLKKMGYVGTELGARTMVNVTSKVPKKKDWPHMLAIWHDIVCKVRTGNYGINLAVDRNGWPGNVTFDTIQWRTDGAMRSKNVPLD